jgi:NADPH:quinone reductase-like Zn-dependent oxidoreductase
VEIDAWILDEAPGTYRWGKAELPPATGDTVQVRVVASALNHLDVWSTKGMPKPPLPHVPGCDVAGVVEAVGPDVSTVAVGDEVVINPGVSPTAEIEALGNDSPLGRGFMIYGEHTWGGHASHANAPARNVVRRPAGRTWEECAAYPLAWLTAYRMLRRARLAAGQTVLVVGIGSGVSCAAMAIARHLGAEVVATSRSEAKRDAALRMGAIAALDSTNERWDVRADIVVESVGPATWERSMRTLKPGGRLVVCGGTSGGKVELSLPVLFFKQYEVIGSSMGSYQEFAEVTQLVAEGLPVYVDKVFELADYPAALQRMDAGDQLGKIVLHH